MKRFCNRFSALLLATPLLLTSSAQATNLYVGDIGTFVLNTFNGSGSLINHDPGPADFTPQGVAVRTDGSVFVASQSSGIGGVVEQFDANGTFVGDFVAFDSGGLRTPTGMIFGPDGNLYVSDFQNDTVSEYNGTTGAFIASLFPTNTLNGPEGLGFGPDGDLYIVDGSGIQKWDGTTLSTFVLFANALAGAYYDLTFGPNGDIYATNSTPGVVEVFDSSGNFLMSFDGGRLSGPVGLRFGSDGNLYVAGSDTGGSTGPAIMEFDTSGNFVQDFVTYNGKDTFQNPQFLAFQTPEPSTFMFGAIGLAGLIALRRRVR